MSYITSDQRPISSSSTEINPSPSSSSCSSTATYTFSNEALQSLIKESILDYSLPEIRNLEQTKKLIKNIEGNQSENYLRLKALVHEVRMAHLPMRSYQLWKKGTYSTIALRGNYVENDFFLYRDHLIKETRKRAKADLFELSAPQKVQENLKLLSRITFLHGSNTAALAMMHGLEEPALICTGSLFAQHIAPMGGANDTGISSTGVNLTKISTETTRDVKRILHYTQVKPFDPSNELLLNPFSSIVDIENLPQLARALEKFKNEHPEEFAQNYSLGSFKRQKLVECLKLIASKVESERDEALSAFDNPEEFKAIFGIDLSQCPDPRMLDMMKADMSQSANDTIQSLLTFSNVLESGDDFTAALSIEGESEGINENHFVEGLRNLFSNSFSNRSRLSNWNIYTIKILQLKQWDHELFVNQVLPFSVEWTAAINREHAFVTGRLSQILKVLEHEFTEEEISFIKSISSEANTSANELPVGLQTIFASVDEIGKWGYLDSGTPLAVSLRRDYLVARVGYASWPELIRGVIDKRIEGKDFSADHSVIAKYLKTMEMCYQNITRALSDEPSPFQIPMDPMIRSLIIQPAPMIFASTTVKPAPLYDSVAPDEFVLDRPTKLGRGGCDIIFTDTEASIERIKLALPQNVVEEIQFRLFEDLDVNGAPLVHSADQIDTTKYVT